MYVLILQYVFTNFACRVNCKSQLSWRKTLKKLAVKVNYEKKNLLHNWFSVHFFIFSTLSSFLGKYILSFVDPGADQAQIKDIENHGGETYFLVNKIFFNL